MRHGCHLHRDERPPHGHVRPREIGVRPSMPQAFCDAVPTAVATDTRCICAPEGVRMLDHEPDTNDNPTSTTADQAPEATPAPRRRRRAATRQAGPDENDAAVGGRGMQDEINGRVRMDPGADQGGMPSKGRLFARFHSANAPLLAWGRSQPPHCLGPGAVPLRERRSLKLWRTGIPPRCRQIMRLENDHQITFLYAM